MAKLTDYDRQWATKVNRVYNDFLQDRFKDEPERRDRYRKELSNLYQEHPKFKGQTSVVNKLVSDLIGKDGVVGTLQDAAADTINIGVKGAPTYLQESFGNMLSGLGTQDLDKAQKAGNLVPYDQIQQRFFQRPYQEGLKGLYSTTEQDLFEIDPGGDISQEGRQIPNPTEERVRLPSQNAPVPRLPQTGGATPSETGQGKNFFEKLASPITSIGEMIRGEEPYSASDVRTGVQYYNERPLREVETERGLAYRPDKAKEAVEQYGQDYLDAFDRQNDLIGGVLSDPTRIAQLAPLMNPALTSMSQDFSKDFDQQVGPLLIKAYQDSELEGLVRNTVLPLVKDAGESLLKANAADMKKQPAAKTLMGEGLRSLLISSAPLATSLTAALITKKVPKYAWSKDPKATAEFASRTALALTSIPGNIALLQSEARSGIDYHPTWKKYSARFSNDAEKAHEKEIILTRAAELIGDQKFLDAFQVLQATGSFPIGGYIGRISFDTLVEGAEEGYADTPIVATMLNMAMAERLAMKAPELLTSETLTANRWEWAKENPAAQDKATELGLAGGLVTAAPVTAIEMATEYKPRLGNLEDIKQMTNKIFESIQTLPTNDTAPAQTLINQPEFKDTIISIQGKIENNQELDAKERKILKWYNSLDESIILRDDFGDTAPLTENDILAAPEQQLAEGIGSEYDYLKNLSEQSGMAENTPSAGIQIGDQVQWESQGQIQFENPRKVLDLFEYEGQTYAFVEGTNTGIPVEQLTKTKPSNTTVSFSSNQKQNNPPDKPLSATAQKKMAREMRKLQDKEARLKEQEQALRNFYDDEILRQLNIEPNPTPQAEPPSAYEESDAFSPIDNQEEQARREAERQAEQARREAERDAQIQMLRENLADLRSRLEYEASAPSPVQQVDEEIAQEIQDEADMQQQIEDIALADDRLRSEVNTEIQTADDQGVEQAIFDETQQQAQTLTTNLEGIRNRVERDEDILRQIDQMESEETTQAVLADDQAVADTESETFQEDITQDPAAGLQELQDAKDIEAEMDRPVDLTLDLSPENTKKSEVLNGVKVNPDTKRGQEVLKQRELEVLKDIMKQYFPNASEVVVLETMEDLKKIINIPDTATGVEGATVSNDGGNTFTVYLIGENLKGTDLRSAVERGVKVYHHESIGHAGLESMLGPEKFQRFADKLYNKRQAEIDAFIEQRYPNGLPNDTPTERVKEWLAQNFTENGVERLGFLDRLFVNLGFSGATSDRAIKKEYQKVYDNLAKGRKPDLISYNRRDVQGQEDEGDKEAVTTTNQATPETAAPVAETTAPSEATSNLAPIPEVPDLLPPTKQMIESARKRLSIPDDLSPEGVDILRMQYDLLERQLNQMTGKAAFGSKAQRKILDSEKLQARRMIAEMTVLKEMLDKYGATTETPAAQPTGKYSFYGKPVPNPTENQLNQAREKVKEVKDVDEFLATREKILEDVKPLVEGLSSEQLQLPTNTKANKVRAKLAEFLALEELEMSGQVVVPEQTQQISQTPERTFETTVEINGQQVEPASVLPQGSPTTPVQEPVPDPDLKVGDTIRFQGQDVKVVGFEDGMNGEVVPVVEDPKTGDIRPVPRSMREDIDPDGPMISLSSNRDLPPDAPKMGINVRTDRQAQRSYADLIVDGEKSLESRNTDSLRPYVGQRMAIVRTGEGQAQAIGEVTVGEPQVVNQQQFRALQDQHLVPEGSAFDIQENGQKYLYPMENPVRYDNPAPVGRGIVARQVNPETSETIEIPVGKSKKLTQPVQRYWYHSVMGNPSEYSDSTIQPSLGKRKETAELLQTEYRNPDPRGFVWLSPTPLSDSAIRIDVSKLDTSKMRLTGQAEGYAIYNGEIPVEAQVNSKASFSSNRQKQTPPPKPPNTRDVESVRGVLASVDMFLDPKARLPHREELENLLQETRGKQTRIIESGRKFATVFMAATPDEQKLIKAFMENRNADPNLIPDRQVSGFWGGKLRLRQLTNRQLPTLREAAVQAKKEIEQIGLDLVRLGQITPETFKERRGKYLPRVYLKYLLDESQSLFAGGANLQVSDQGYRKQLQDIDEQTRILFLGEIESPGYLVGRTLLQAGQDVAKMDFLNAVAQNKEWVLPDSQVKLNISNLVNDIITRRNLGQRLTQEGFPAATRQKRDRRVSPEFLMAEADRIEEQILPTKKPGSAQEELVQAIANEYRQLGKAARDKIRGYDHKAYRQLPNSNRYGDLRGAYVRKEIANLVMGDPFFISKDTANASPGAALASDFERAASTFNSIFKWKMTAASPTAWMNNLKGNTGSMAFAGLPVHRNLDYRLRAGYEILRNGKRYQQYKDLGLIQTTFASDELGRMNSEFKTQLTPKERKLVYQNRKLNALRSTASYQTAMNVLGRIYNTFGDIYQGLEIVDKLAVAMYLEDHGANIAGVPFLNQEEMTASEAMKEANKYLFDYSDVDPAIKKVRKSLVGAPFITWTYKQTDLLRKMMKDPQAMLRAASYYAMVYATIAANEAELDDDEYEAYLKALPEYYDKHGMLTFPTPIKDENGRVQIEDMFYAVPHAYLYQFLTTAVDPKYGGWEAISDLGFFNHPLLKETMQQVANKDFYTGREISSQFDSLATGIDKRFKHFRDTVMPSLFSPTSWERQLLETALQAMEMNPNLFGERANIFDYRGEQKKTFAQTINRMANPFNETIASPVTSALGLSEVGRPVDLEGSLRFQIRDLQNYLRQKAYDQNKNRIAFANDPKALRESEKQYEKDRKDLMRQMAELQRALANLPKLKDNPEYTRKKRREMVTQ